MSDRMKDLLAALMVVLLASTAFAAGYFVNDLLAARRGDRAAAAGDDFEVFWEAWDHIEQSYIGQLPTTRELAYGAIRGAISVLNDPYTLFIEPEIREQEREALRGNFGGIGATVVRNEAGEVVLTPIPGNPAEAAGIVDGDVLLAVDGVQVTADMTVEAIVELVRGEKGTVVTLTIRHPGAQEAVEVAVERADILIPSVTARVLPEDRTIGYIQLTRFSGESSEEVRQAIEALQAQGAQALILDLRQNGGGLLDAAVAVSDHFLTEGPILYQISKASDEQVFTADGASLGADMALVILVDGGTASSSEIVAGALQDRERATLIGTRTFGKGSVQLVYDLSDGSSVHVTSARWYTPDRHQIDQEGLQPDIVVEPTQEAIADGRDETLGRAIEYLQNGN